MSDPAGGGRGIIEKSKSEQLGLQKLEFLKKRRELFLELLETTGARPGELIALKVSELDNCTETLRISLPTLKRRKASDPERTIPIEASVAIKIELFIHKQRNELLFNIRENGLTPDPQDRIFLSAINGQPISKGAIDKEFQRIVKKAGITQKACMSLFRHRFITNMIKIHLRAFLNENEGASRLVMTDSDYRTILKKVATFTGHASEMSLFHYIDLAWDELGIFDYVEPATKLVNAVESSITSITSLAGDVRQKRKISNKNLSEFVITELTKIKKTVTDALDGSFRSS